MSKNDVKNLKKIFLKFFSNFRFLLNAVCCSARSIDGNALRYAIRAYNFFQKFKNLLNLKKRH